MSPDYVNPGYVVEFVASIPIKNPLNGTIRKERFKWVRHFPAIANFFWYIRHESWQPAVLTYRLIDSQVASKIHGTH